MILFFVENFAGSFELLKKTGRCYFVRGTLNAFVFVFLVEVLDKMHGNGRRKGFATAWLTGENNI